MSFNYSPDDAAKTLPEGEYDASIEDCKEEMSKAGNPMLHLSIKAYNGSTSVFVHDYITAPHGIWKLKQLCEALDMPFDGNFEPESAKGRSVKVWLVEEDDAKYGPKNNVDKYTKMNGPAPAAAQQDEDKDCPF